MYFKENKGVTLMALTITIIVMLIITSTIIYNTNSHIRIEKINKLYNDIENISNKIEDYYLKYGEIPTIGNVYCSKTVLTDLLSKNANAQSATLNTLDDNVIINPNDGDEYYIIDLEKLEGLTLNYGYGDDYKTAKNTPDSITTELDEIYIINKATHQIYYPSGVFADDFMYYSYSLDTNKAIKEYNVSSKDNTDNTDNIISFNNENIVNVNSLKVYGNSIQNGDPAPDNPVEIESVGDLVTDTTDENYGKYKIPVTVSGKNLLNINDITNNNPGVKNLKINGNSFSFEKAITSYTSCVSTNIYLEKGTYTISGEWSSDNGERAGFAILDGNAYVLNYAGKGVNKVFEINENKTYRFSFYDHYGAPVDTVTTFTNIQIEKGTEKTEYEPYYEVTQNVYLKEPLRKVGNPDCIDLLNKKVVRNVGYVEFKGTERWSLPTMIVEGYSSYRLVEFFNTAPVQTFYCSHFSAVPRTIYSSPPYSNRATSYSNTSQLIIQVSDNIAYSNDQKTLENWNSWLSDQYNNGTPVKIYYSLATSIEEPIGLPTIPMNEGTNIITIGTETTPSEIELSYYEINK